MNGVGIIYDREGKPAVITIALNLIDDDRLKALVNDMLIVAGYAPIKFDDLPTPNAELP